MRTRCVFFATVVGIIASTSAAPAPAVAQRLYGSDAARTSLVLIPGVGLDYGSTGKGMNGFIWLGGRIDWLPRLPVVLTVGANQEIAGASGWSGYEVGGGWRFRETLRSGTEEVVVSAERIPHDSVRTTYVAGETAVRHYNVLRAGLLSNQSVLQGGALGGGNVTTSSVYIGMSRNDLVSQQGGLMGHRAIRTTSIDVLFGSPGATAPKSNAIGARASFNFDYGNIFDMRFEGGLRPGLGGYFQISINGYFMITDILR